MPYQINNISLKSLIENHDRETKILKAFYKQEEFLGRYQQVEVLRFLAKRKAERKILEEVRNQKSTNIKVEQISLFI